MLHKHQIDAVDKISSENFDSGIVFYATGTGKSKIGFEVVNQFNLKYQTSSIMWICEHKYILNELFKNNKYITKNLIIKLIIIYLFILHQKLGQLH